MKRKQPQSETKPRTVFAALARVSSEKSEKQGESLANQKAHIAASVKALGGDPERDIIWDFCGQEHTMSDRASHERKLLRGLMDEVASGHARFQAVMLQFLDRIGRNKKMFDALIELLTEHDVGLYQGTGQIDLDDEAEGLTVGMQKEFSHYWARRTLRSSMAGKIAKAKKGIYVQGPKIYGHEPDEEDRTKWHVDTRLRKTLELAAARLDRGERFRSVAEKAGIEASSLYKGLRRAGSVFKFSLGTEVFKKYSRKRGNAFEYEVRVEPLVRDEEMLKRVLARIDANAKRFSRKPRALKDPNRVDFALKGLVRCGHCGYVMPAHAVKSVRVPDSELKRRRKRRRNPDAKNYYYQHALWYGCYKEYRKQYPNGAKRGTVDKPFPFTVNADRVDVAACAALFEELDTSEVLKNALDESAKSNGKEQKAVEQNLQDLRVKKDQFGKQKKRLIDVIKSGLQRDKDLATEVKRVNDQMDLVQIDIDAEERRQRLAKTPATIQERAEVAKKSLYDGMRESLRLQWKHGLKALWESLTEPDDETGETLSVKDRARRRAELLTNGQRRNIVLPLLEEPGCGVFVFKRKDGLHGVIKAHGYPEIKFRI